MDNKQEKMEALLKQAEQELRQNPREYEKKLLHYSMLGYGIILLLVVILAALVGGTIVLALSSSLFLLLLFKKKLIIPLFIMVWVLFKSVFIRFPKPEGITLTRDQNPELFKLIDEVRNRLESAPVHKVIVTPELNAALIQTPRFLAFGFTHNTLVLGFELLMSLTAEELKSVIGHELGHLSGNHSKFHGWIYRSRESWRNMMFNLDQHNGWTTAPIRKFFNWYSPMFSAYSFALARLNEYEADKIAASFGSDKIAASALLKLPVYGQFIQEKYWDSFNETLLTHPKPPTMPYVGLIEFMNNNKVSISEAKAAIEFARKTTTNYHDTHPCLNERLAALNCNDIEFVATELSAGKALLGKYLHDVAKQLDYYWSESALESWQQEYQKAQQEKQQLQKLEELPETELDQQQHWDHAWLSEKFSTVDSPLSGYQSYQARYPDDPKCLFAMGRLLIKAKDSEGLDWLEKAMQKDEFIEPAGQLAYEYLVDIGEPEKANNWLSKVYDLEETYRKAQEERAILSHNDILKKPDVDMSQFEKVTDIIHDHKHVKQVWVAQKKVRYFTDSPVLIFAIKTRRGFFLADNLPDKLLELMPPEMPKDAVVYILTKGNNAKIYRKVLEFGTELI